MFCLQTKVIVRTSNGKDQALQNCCICSMLGPQSLEEFVTGEFEEEGFLAYVEELDAGFGVVAGAFYGEYATYAETVMLYYVTFMQNGV